MKISKKEKTMLSDAFQNRITEPPQGIEATEIACPQCQEAMIFALKIGEKEVSIGLNTILACLKIAEKEGYVPPLEGENSQFFANSWWCKIERMYPDLSFD